MNTGNGRPITGALPLWQRRAVQWAGLAAWLTGAVWLIFKYFIRVTDEFGFDNPHPQQQAWLIAHAFVSLALLWLFGLLWHHHIARGWQQKLRRATGGTLFGVLAWLGLSGCALYYLGSDTAREWTSLAHWVVGLAAIAAYLLHDRRKNLR